MTNRVSAVIACALFGAACDRGAPVTAPVVAVSASPDASPEPPATASVVPDAAPPQARESKVTDPAALRAAIKRAGPHGVVALYARLDPATAPSRPEDQKRELEPFGVTSISSENLGTFRVPVERIEEFLARPYVLSIELARPAKLR